MKDIQGQLDKIRSDAAECLLLSSLASDEKRQVFVKTAEHLNALAFEVEKSIANYSAESGARGDTQRMARAEDREGAVATDIPAAHHQQETRPRRALLWLLVAVLGIIVGAFFWVNSSAREYWFLSTLQSKHQTLPAPQDETKRAIAAFLADQQVERKILMDQLSALTTQVDNLTRSLDGLKTTRAEVAGRESRGGDEKPPSAEAVLSEPKNSVRREENQTAPKLETPAAVKQSGGMPTAIDGALAEPSDQVGAIPVAPRRAELADPRKPAVGPQGCTQFRSFDPVSGTYWTLEGRRRECRQ